MNYITFLFFFTLLANFNIKCESGKCYQRSNHSYSFFATKTVYSYVSAKENYTQPNCKALQLWLLSRHGTRHPSADMIDKISSLTYYKNQITENSTLCKEDIDEINKWDFNLTKQDGNKLNSQGVQDLSSLGSRLKYLYNDIFDKSYDTQAFKVLSSPKSRCVDSAIQFLNSAFAMNITDIPLIDRDDTKLNISKFKKLNDDDDYTKESEFQELKAFYNGIHFQQLLDRVSKTLGLNYNMTFDTVQIMYESCRYDKSWRINSHPAWCAVFSQEDLELLEYGEDLKYYYTNGYGNSYNERIGCPIVKNLIENFRNATRSRSGPRGVFYFGHSSNVLSAVVRLGIARDAAPLSSTDYVDGDGGARDRKWRTSRLSPFAANVMAVLYKCPDEHKVTFFVNQVPTAVETLGCTLCPWRLIDEMFGPIVSAPSCEAPPGRTPTTSSAAVLRDASKTAVILPLLLRLLVVFCFRL